MNKTNFWALMSEYKVEIPKIQRDYAQGRTDQKTNIIAEQFLTDIKAALEKDTELSLDFVYGKIENGRLIPIDGQQRLTTLFLLYWYFAVKEHRLTDDVKTILSKFTYETRLTSIDFCNGLVEHGNEYADVTENLKSAIEDSAWYFASWKYDPTIVSMLNMTEKIHGTFKDMQSLVFERLIKPAPDSIPITFYFLPMEDFKLTDELYIKMNARGKQLTDFENFKTIFSGYLENMDDKAKLDNEWLDIFWKLEKEHAEEEKSGLITDDVDKRYLAFFKNTASNFYAESCLEPDKTTNRTRLIDYPLFTEYDAMYKNQTAVQETIIILDSLVSYKDDKKIFKNFISDSPSYYDRVRFYALSRYFIWSNSDNKHAKTEIYKRWMRVTLNLINNTFIESPKDYKDAIDSMKALSAHIANIYEHIGALGNKISFFLSRQCDEERVKAQLILEDSTWESVIIDAESHPYFDGQIGFILDYAKNQKGKYDKKAFKNYAAILSALFNEKAFQENDAFLFQRALLTKGNYLVQSGGNYSFCKFEPGLRAKSDNWRRVFNDNKKTLFLKALLDDLGNAAIQQGLERIIAESNTDDWRDLIIKNSAHIAYCEKKQIYTDDWKKMYLVSKTRMNSYHAELFSYNLYLTSFKDKNNDYPPFSSVRYYEPTSSREEPCIALDEFFYDEGNCRYHFVMDIAHTGNRVYRIVFKDRNENKLPERIADILKQAGFSINDMSAELCPIPESTIEQTVREIFNMFSKTIACI